MQASPLNPTNTAPWYRHLWPWLLMAGPLVVVIAGTITMWISFAGADALVVDDYYKQGKAINQDLRRERVAASLDLQLALRYDAVAGNLQGQLSGEQPGRKLTLMLVHPTMPSKDMKRSLVTHADGSFTVPLPMLERAHWQVELEDDARQWRLHGDWHWPEQKNTDIQAVQGTVQNAKQGGR